jgi:hypothetical protein
MTEIERCARLMGMKPAEVVEAVSVDEGHAVRTHDGQWTLVRDDGTVRPGAAPEVTLARDSGVEAGPAQAPPKRRARS